METQNESLNQAPSTRSAGIRFGIILGIISSVSFLVIAITGINVNDGPGAWANRVFSLAISCLFIYLAHDHFKKNGDGYMSFGQGFGIGFWVSLISTIIAIVFTYVYVKFVDGGFIEMILQTQREAMQAKGQSDEEVERAMGYVAKFTTAEMIAVFGFIFSLIFGAIVSLVMAAIDQKKDPNALPI